MSLSNRPQQARSIATREKIVGAMGGCLSALGYAGASTQAVASRAGVSQGALFKHFGNKSELLAACVERSLFDFVTGFRAELAVLCQGARPLPERIRPTIAALWRIFRTPAMTAVFEVYLAARTDAALARALGPILERHRQNILTEARCLFPELPTDARFDAAVDAVVYAMQGVVLGVFTPDAPGAADDAHHLDFFERLARRELEFALRADAEVR